jgi:hypothetical protein
MALFQIDPSKQYAGVVNKELEYAQSPMMTPAAIINQEQQAYPGDPLAQQGFVLPGGVKWVDATQVQQAIYNAVSEMGLDASTFAADITGTPGPDLMWNWSYTQLGIPSPSTPTHAA